VPVSRKKPLTRAESDAQDLRVEAITHHGTVPVPFLGTTWRARGAAYWWRRAGAVVLFLALLALVGGMATGFSIGIFGDGHSPVRVVLGVLYLLTVAPGLWLGGRMVARAPLVEDPPATVVLPIGLLALVLAPFDTGLVLVLLLAMLGRDFLGERRARAASKPSP
jgi:hypothetical protein